MPNTSVQPRWSPNTRPFSKLAISAFLDPNATYHAGTSVHLNNIKNNLDFPHISLEEILYEDCYVDFPNYDFYLRRQVLKCDSVNELKEQLLKINRWCFLNVGPREYGFYNPAPFTYNRENTVRILDFKDVINSYSCIVFKRSEDLLAFKLKF